MSQKKPENIWTRSVSSFKKLNAFFRFALLPIIFVSGYVLVNFFSTAANIVYPYPLLLTLVLFIGIIVFNIDATAESEAIDRVISFTMLIVFASPILAYMFVIVASKLPELFIRFGSKDAWIGFLGSIIGGSMTMFAVAFTIIDQNNKRDQDEAKRKAVQDERDKKDEDILKHQIMPIPTIEFVQDVGSINTEMNYLVGFNLSNHSSNAVFVSSISIKKISYSKSYVADKESVEIKDAEIMNAGEIVIAGNHSTNIPITILDKDAVDYLKESSDERKINIYISCIIYFSDIRGLQKYSMEVRKFLSVESNYKRMNSLVFKYRRLPIERDFIPVRISEFPQGS